MAKRGTRQRLRAAVLRRWCSGEWGGGPPWSSHPSGSDGVLAGQLASLLLTHMPAGLRSVFGHWGPLCRLACTAFRGAAGGR